ncbi:Pre-rRNA-processing protein TSR2-domain-containing protein [Pseudomassariella vexata]|uniref:Pre-rRNA-processing protein TSR2-domain-containing protein n=1 Tax=Pseudomassariella vexata TaxID=1141098 RepID=A0A1Y2DPV8_9PEZI|nr:Pre-rRNA-processing protein TSR2-domain-containing protein [Pseudomassariella vexata]ORY61318.1 Pre-rRNA-processing protein TSR2-domain-containing protein [Pseudomassariella vexata]
MASQTSTSQSKVSSPAKLAQIRQQNFEQAVALSLHLWPALTVAVQNNWSDENAEDVRDWFCGAIVELFPSFVALAKLVESGKEKPEDHEEPDAEYVEERLLQVMADEYQVAVDDGSSHETANEIIRLRAACARDQFEGVDELRRRFESRKGKKIVLQVAPDVDQDTDWESDDDEDDDDVEMDEAPALAPVRKEKPQPEIDEDGFEKVTRKKR